MPKPRPLPLFYGGGQKYHRRLKYLSCKMQRKCLENVIGEECLKYLFFISIFTKNTVRLAIPKSAAVSSNGECYLAFGKVNKAKKVHCF